jgi:hypothetical protein
MYVLFYVTEIGSAYWEEAPLVLKISGFSSVDSSFLKQIDLFGQAHVAADREEKKGIRGWKLAEPKEPDLSGLRSE